LIKLIDDLLLSICKASEYCFNQGGDMLSNNHRAAFWRFWYATHIHIHIHEYPTHTHHWLPLEWVSYVSRFFIL